MMKQSSSVITYDLRGLRCPLVVLKIDKKLKTMCHDDILQVLSDDPLAPLDIEHLCKTYRYGFICKKNDSYADIFIQVIKNKN